ncbi:MAG: N-acetyltransferase [Chloroflexi bacterium]|nr:MAG: N-acetyltransferase [Chloroflexota bacterium]
MAQSSIYIHPTAEVSPEAYVGAGTRIWRHAHIREHAHIGETCNIGKGVYIDVHVHIGSHVKIQNNSSIFEGVTLEDGVFVGPHVCFTNDLAPRAITPTGKLKSADDWEITPTLVKYGASIGAGAVIVCGITIGEFALVGAGSVVTGASSAIRTFISSYTRDMLYSLWNRLLCSAQVNYCNVISDNCSDFAKVIQSAKIR